MIRSVILNMAEKKNTLTITLYLVQWKVWKTFVAIPDHLTTKYSIIRTGIHQSGDIICLACWNSWAANYMENINDCSEPRSEKLYSLKLAVPVQLRYNLTKENMNPKTRASTGCIQESVSNVCFFPHKLIWNI